MKAPRPDAFGLSGTMTPLMPLLPFPGVIPSRHVASVGVENRAPAINNSGSGPAQVVGGSKPKALDPLDPELDTTPLATKPTHRTGRDVAGMAADPLAAPAPDPQPSKPSLPQTAVPVSFIPTAVLVRNRAQPAPVRRRKPPSKSMTSALPKTSVKDKHELLDAFMAEMDAIDVPDE